MAWIYLTGFIFLPLCSLKALRRLQRAGSVLTEHNTTRENDVVELVALLGHNLLNSDRLNVDFSITVGGA